MINDKMFKSLISINHKFMSINPTDLVSLLLKSKYINGIEIYIDANKKEELEYLDDLISELKKNSLTLQVHGEITLEYNKQLVFLKKLEKYADYLKMPIVVTFHPIYDENKEISINKTIDCISKIIDSVDNRIIICLENLNNLNGLNRLGKKDVEKIILNNDRLFFTYDLGHELADDGNLINLDEQMRKSIRNIHIHSKNNEGIDHMPIYDNDSHLNELLNGLEFAIYNHCSNVVFEYALDYCDGNSIKEKIKKYIESIDFVSSKFEKEREVDYASRKI